jgi:hypothetical protein
MPLHVSSTRAHRQEAKIVLYNRWYHHTYRWPPRAREIPAPGRRNKPGWNYDAVGYYYFFSFQVHVLNSSVRSTYLTRNCPLRLFPGPRTFHTPLSSSCT